MSRTNRISFIPALLRSIRGVLVKNLAMYFVFPRLHCHFFSLGETNNKAAVHPLLTIKPFFEMIGY